MKNFKLVLPLLLVTTALQLSCGESLDPAENISIAVSPSKAFIVPGKGSSCVAQSTAKTEAEPVIADVDGDRVTFSRFVLQWRSGAKLTIASVRATIFSDGIAGAEGLDGVTVELAEDEIAALLGLTNLTIAFPNPYVDDRVVDRDSTDEASKGTLYAACGLQIGGLASKPGVRTYTARIKVEVIGFSTACLLQDNGTCNDGEQRPVRQSVTVQAQKF